MLAGRNLSEGWKIENSRRNFIPRNDSFLCEACDSQVPPASGTFRNHCPHCLTGKHVDKAIPGDRASSCHGLMPTISYRGTDPDRLQLIQQCQSCDKIHANKLAPDDNRNLLFSQFSFHSP